MQICHLTAYYANEIEGGISKFDLIWFVNLPATLQNNNLKCINITTLNVYLLYSSKYYLFKKYFVKSLVTKGFYKLHPWWKE